MSKQPELLYLSFLSIIFSCRDVEADWVCLHRFSVVLHFCFIQTALSSQHSLHARNLLMRPLTGLPATVVITLGLSLVGSFCSLLSSPTGNHPAFPKLILIACPTMGVLAHPSAQLSQKGCYLIKVIQLSKGTRTAGIKLSPDLVREESVGKLPSPTTSRERHVLGSLIEKNRKFFPGGINGLIYRYFRAAFSVRNLLVGHSLKVVAPDTAFLRLGERFNGSM